MSCNKSLVLTAKEKKLPIWGLLAFSTALFISILTEALPAGFLLDISADFNVPLAIGGQMVSVYAIGSLLSAIPLTLATQSWPRKQVLVMSIMGFLVTNLVTAISYNFWLVLVARFLAGIFAGLLWAIIAGYAARMVSAEQRGRAITIAMIGVPLALSLGIPLGTFIGSRIGWRLVFYLISFISVILIPWILLVLPNFPGISKDKKGHSLDIFRVKGILAIIIVNFTFACAHNTLYTYIAPYLDMHFLKDKIDLILLIFGVASVLSIVIVGIFIDKYLRLLVLSSIVLFVLSCVSLSIPFITMQLIFVSIFIWGLAFGGAATLFQTASAKTAGESADFAQSLMVTAWNLAIAGGGIIGGIIVDYVGVNKLTWFVILLLLLAFSVVLNAKKHGFD